MVRKKYVDNVFFSQDREMSGNFKSGQKILGKSGNLKING